MERPRNITELIEERRLGYCMPNQLDMGYSRLRCLPSDVNYFHDSCGDRDYCPIFACKFCPHKGHENLVIVANEDGKVKLLDTEASDKKKVLSSFQAHDNAIFELAWALDKVSFFTVSGDHSVSLWQVTEADVQLDRHFFGHLHSVKAISCKPDDHAVFSTGGRDGAIFIWDRRISNPAMSANPDKVIKCSHESPSIFKLKRMGGNSVTGLVFQDDNNLISCSANDGILKVWDMRKTYFTSKNRVPIAKHNLRYCGTGRNGFSSVAISPCRSRLYANCIDNYVYCYDISTYNTKPIAKYGGHDSCSSFYIKNSVSPDGRYISCGSYDKKAYIWSAYAKTSLPLVTLTGHTSEVSSVDWCKDGKVKMVTCSDDTSFRIWRLNSENIPSSELSGWAEECSDFQQFVSAQHTRKQKFYCSHTQNNKPRQNTPPNPNTCSTSRSPSKNKQSDEDSIASRMLADFPNLVLDGSSPHVHHCSLTPKSKDHWLSQFRPKMIARNSKSPQASAKRRLNSNLSPARKARGDISRFFKICSHEPAISLPQSQDSDSSFQN